MHLNENSVQTRFSRWKNNCNHHRKVTIKCKESFEGEYSLLEPYHLPRWKWQWNPSYLRRAGPEEEIKYCRPTIESSSIPLARSIFPGNHRRGCPPQLHCVCNNASRFPTASERFKQSISLIFFSYPF